MGEELRKLGCAVTLLVSPKEVDQQAVRAVQDMEVVTLPMVGLTRGNVLQFARCAWSSYRQCRTLFRRRKPQAVVAMGGFTSVPPVLAGRSVGAKTFLHESNSIPGRSNWLLARRVDAAFVYFPQAAGRLRWRRVEVVGMPVRRCLLEPMEAGAARAALGLHPDQPVLLVVGGSQGARGVNELVCGALPRLREAMPALQFIHLTGPLDFEKVRAAYAPLQARAVVRAFLPEMELALASATLAVSRAGASSLAELAARRLPSILVPYPSAANNHQFFNAQAFVESDAARMVLQGHVRPGLMADEILQLAGDPGRQAAMSWALERWRTPEAAGTMAGAILRAIENAENGEARLSQPPKPKVLHV